MSSLSLAAASVEPLVLFLRRYSGTAVRCVRYVMEHVFNQGALPWLQSSVAMDIVPAMRAVVVTCRLVPTERGPALDQSATGGGRKIAALFYLRRSTQTTQRPQRNSSKSSRLQTRRDARSLDFAWDAAHTDDTSAQFVPDTPARYTASFACIMGYQVRSLDPD